MRESRVHLGLSCVTVALLGLAGSAVSAQSIALGAQYGSTRAERLDHAYGLNVAAHLGRVPLRLHLDLLRRSQEGVGVPCVPIFIPESCPGAPEPVRIHASLWTMGLGWVVPIVQQSRWGVRAVPEATYGRINGSTRGLESGDQIGGTGSMFGLGLGGELGFVPAVDSRLSVWLRGVVRQRWSVSNVRCDDCYEPYAEGFRSRSIGVLLEYQTGRQ